LKSVKVNFNIIPDQHNDHIWAQWTTAVGD
jgi:hypothetical protein